MPVRSHVRHYTKNGRIGWIGPYSRSKRTARGLPDKNRNTPLPIVKRGESRTWHFSTQLHDAKRAGTHIDLRLGDPRTGIAHSWAVPKAVLPEPGRHVLAVSSGDHTIPYMDFSGLLPSGYGAGAVKLQRREPTEVVYSDADLIKFVLHKGNGGSEEFILRRTNDKAWLLQNVTPSKAQEDKVRLVEALRKQLDKGK